MRTPSGSYSQSSRSQTLRGTKLVGQLPHHVHCSTRAGSRCRSWASGEARRVDGGYVDVKIACDDAFSEPPLKDLIRSTCRFIYTKT